MIVHRYYTSMRRKRLEKSIVSVDAFPIKNNDMFSHININHLSFLNETIYSHNVKIQTIIYIYIYHISKSKSVYVFYVSIYPLVI